MKIISFFLFLLYFLRLNFLKGFRLNGLDEEEAIQASSIKERSKIIDEQLDSDLGKNYIYSNNIFW